jgi:hypothetical protein
VATRIIVRIGEDGEISAETRGIKGPDCRAYIEVLEQLLNAQTTESWYTEDYYATDVKIQESQPLEENT